MRPTPWATRLDLNNVERGAVDLMAAHDPDRAFNGGGNVGVQPGADPGQQGGAPGPCLFGVGDLDGESQGVGQQLAPYLAAGASAAQPRGLGDVEPLPERVHMESVVERHTLDDGSHHVVPGSPYGAFEVPGRAPPTGHVTYRALRPTASRGNDRLIPQRDFTLQMVSANI
nr:hypothetical protein [Actinomadura rudentiformis]